MAFWIILGILIVVHELGHFCVARLMGVKVEQFSLGFGPRLLSRTYKDTVYSLSAIPLGGYVKMAGDSLEEFSGKPNEFYAKPVWRRALIIFCGPLLNYFLGLLVFWYICFTGYPMLTTKIGAVLPGYGAEAAGLLPGDRILAIDGATVPYWEDMQARIRAKSEAESVEVLYERDGQRSQIPVRLRPKQMEDPLGAKLSVGILGVSAADEIVTVRYGLFEAFGQGIRKGWELTELTYKALWRMVTRRLSFRDSVAGPLRIYYMTSEAAKLGMTALLHLIAALSVNLAVFNLLPLPILDGGHLALLVVEKIRGRNLSRRAERIVNQVGMAFMLLLAGAVVLNDILRLFGDKIGKLF